MRCFQLVRVEDVSGVSGTGVVAEGVQFANGRCALSWLGKFKTINIYERIEDLLAIHGHEGRTRVEWGERSEH